MHRSGLCVKHTLPHFLWSVLYSCALTMPTGDHTPSQQMQLVTMTLYSPFPAFFFHVGIVTLLFGPSLDVGARQATTRCQMLRNEEWIALTESAYDTSMLQAPVCGRRLKIGHMATFRHVPLISDFGIMNTTLAHALADIECSGILGDLSLEVVPAASDCNQKIGMRAFLNLLYESNVAMIIGPECSVTTELVALVASSVKLPILAYSTESPSLSDRDKYDTYFRLNQPGTRHGDGWQLLLEKMDISTVSIIRETGREFDDFVRTFENSIRKSKNLSLADSQTVSEDDFQIRLVMDHVERANARVVVAQVYSTIAQKLLCEAIRRVSDMESCFLMCLVRGAISILALR